MVTLLSHLFVIWNQIPMNLSTSTKRKYFVLVTQSIYVLRPSESGRRECVQSNASMIMSDADLYSDLVEPSKSPKEDDASFLDLVFMEQKEGLLPLPITQLKEEKKQKIRSILEENQRLRQENAVLRRNISILFKTAQAEIERKDRELSKTRHL